MKVPGTNEAPADPGTEHAGFYGLGINVSYDNFGTVRWGHSGAFLLGASTLPFLWNVWRTRKKGEPAGDDPWGGHTLEWATTSPPPPHNFDRLPRIRSNRPVWDMNHPEHPEQH